MRLTKMVRATGIADLSAVKGLDRQTLSFAGYLLLELAAMGNAAPVVSRDGVASLPRDDGGADARPAQAYTKTGRVCKRREAAA